MDELFDMSEQKTSEQPQLWDKNEQEQELQKAIEMYTLRITQGSSIEVQTSSLYELTLIAQQSPEKVINLMKPISQHILRFMNTPVSNSCFAFIRQLYQFSSEKFFQLEDFLTLIIESARLQISQQQNQPLEFLIELFQNEQFIQIFTGFEVAPLFTFKIETISQFLISLPLSPLSQQFTLLQQILKLKFKDDLITQVLNLNIIQSVFESIKNDKLQTVNSVNALKVVFNFVSGEFCSFEKAIGEMIKNKQILHDLFHSLSYQFIQKQQSEFLQYALLITFKIMNICVSNEELKIFFSETKIFDFTSYITCQQDDVVKANLTLIQEALQLLNCLLQNEPKTQNKLAITIIQFGESHIEVPVRLAQLTLIPDLKALAFKVLQSLFASNTELGLTFTASLSKPLRAARKGTWTDGVKMLLKTFALKAPSIQQVQSQSKEFNQFSELLNQMHKQDVDRELQVPQFEIDSQCAQIIVQQLIEGEHAEASELLSNIVCQQKQTAMHFLTACLNFQQLKDIATAQNPVVDTIAFKLFQKMAMCDDERLKSILKVLCSCTFAIKGDAVFQYIICSMGRAEIMFYQVLQMLVNKYLKADDELKGLLGLFLTYAPMKLYQQLIKEVQQFTPELFADIFSKVSLYGENGQCELIKVGIKTKLDEIKAKTQAKIDGKEPQVETKVESTKMDTKEEFISMKKYNEVEHKLNEALKQIQVLQSKNKQLEQSLALALGQPQQQVETQVEKPVESEKQVSLMAMPFDDVKHEEGEKPKNKRKMVSANNYQQQLAKITPLVDLALPPSMQ